MNEPLIWTTKGNIPLADLDYKHEWSEDDNAIMLIETYRLGDEIVKQNRHIKLKQGLVAFPEQATL